MTAVSFVLAGQESATARGLMVTFATAAGAAGSLQAISAAPHDRPRRSRVLTVVSVLACIYTIC